MRVSIVIPVFNAERYLKKCIDSVIQQSYKDLEIILVDDGSTDGSGQICEEYAKIDNRIKVVHQENGGVSSARNNGMKQSNGEFLMFVDSDDYLDLNMVKTMTNSLIELKSDLVICGYFTVSNGQIENISFNDLYLKGKQAIKHHIIRNYSAGSINSPCNKLYKKVLINHYFDNNLSLGEDLLFNLSYLNSVNSINFISDCLYYYRRENSNSLSRRYRKDLFNTIEWLYYNLCSFLKEGMDDSVNYDSVNMSFYKNTISYFVGLVNKPDEPFKVKIKGIEEVCLNKALRDAINGTASMSKSYMLIRLLIRNRMPFSIFFIVKIWSFFRKKVEM